MAPAAPGPEAVAPGRAARPARIQAHLSRWLMVYAMGAITAGLALGSVDNFWWEPQLGLVRVSPMPVVASS